MSDKALNPTEATNGASYDASVDYINELIAKQTALAKRDGASADTLNQYGAATLKHFKEHPEQAFTQKLQLDRIVDYWEKPATKAMYVGDLTTDSKIKAAIQPSDSKIKAAIQAEYIAGALKALSEGATDLREIENVAKKNVLEHIDNKYLKSEMFQLEEKASAVTLEQLIAENAAKSSGNAKALENTVLALQQQYLDRGPSA